MYRARGEPDVDFDALTELIARTRRLSRLVIAGSLSLGVVLGVVAVVLTLESYQGLGGKILGARIGFTFCVAMGVAIGFGILLRKLLLRWALPRWISEMARLGFDAGTLREALTPFVD